MPAECQDTYKRHFIFAILDAVSLGILANAPLIAIKALNCMDWQVAVQLPISSIGMLTVLYLGGVMAGRSPMPFAYYPGAMYAATSFLMAFTLHPLTFLILGGLGTLFETISRPAVTAIIRLQYPPTHRGTITGAIRQWHMIAFLISSALAAALLDLAGAHCFSMIKIQLVFAGLASGAAFLVLRTIRLRSDVETAGGVPMLTLWKPFQDAVAIMRGDRRFLWYLCIGFLYAFGGLIYVSYIPVLFSREFHWNYFTASFMANTLPNLVAILTTGSMGRWIDRVNSWKAWAAIRLGWGADPLLLGFASSLSVVSPAWTWAATFAGRLSRGVVMGGSWILWWQVGVNHFARPGDDTARYMGMIIFVNGLARLSAPVVGGWILLRGFSISAVLIIGSILVLVSGALSQMRYRKERGHARYESMTQFEA